MTSINQFGSMTLALLALVFCAASSRAASVAPAQHVQRSAAAAAAPAAAAPAALPQQLQRAHTPLPPNQQLNHTHSGYLPVNASLGSSLYYIFFEAQEPEGDLRDTPIILWLQGGPGCSSMFGILYLNGPYWVTPQLTLTPNAHTWNRRYGALYLDQPIGVGFSRIGRDRIPNNELDLARQLYQGLQAFYTKHAFHDRPLIVTGESYAGKYVPSISHFIVQAAAMADGTVGRLKKRRALPPDTPPPVFKLGGVAIGNGWVDAEVQLRAEVDVAWAFGLIDSAQKEAAAAMVEQTVHYMQTLQWTKARVMSEMVGEFISNVSATATLEDIRRNQVYDGHLRTDQFFSMHAVQDFMGASLRGYGPNGAWISCDPKVDAIMGHDVMKSVRKLVPDVINVAPVLVYLGQYDAECGVAGNDAWMHRLEWHGHAGYRAAPREVWWLDGKPVGYRKSYGNLTQLVVRGSGHMVPHDQPHIAQLMIEAFVTRAVGGPRSGRGGGGGAERSGAADKAPARTPATEAV